MIILLAPNSISKEELNRLRTDYLKIGVYVELNSKDEWDLLETSPQSYPIYVYPSTPTYPTVTYTSTYTQ